MFFSILKFWFSGLSGGWKVKKWPKMTKFSVCRSLYFRIYISYDLQLWYTCMYKRIISPGIFFIIFFFNILIFEIFRGWLVKGQKNGPKSQKVLSVSLCISGTYIIWLLFWYTCVKWLYLQLIFSFFKILIFRGFSGW